MRRRISIMVRLLAGAMIGLCLPNGATAGTLRLANEGSFRGADSLDPISPVRFYIANQMIYSQLVRAGEDGRPAPDLAVAWSSSADARDWTFTLRRGVKFHDGSDFGAADVVYTLTRINSDKLKSPLRSVLSLIDTVKAVDPYTVGIHLKTPYADFPLLLMDYRVRILSAAHDSSNTDVANASGIGTGPFKLVKLDTLGTTVLEAFDGYWEGRPKIDRVEIINMPDQQARVQALLAGQLDLVLSINQQQRALFEESDGFVVQPVQTGDWRGIAMRTNVPPFADARVRKALRILADRSTMVRLVLGEGGGEVSCDTPAWSGDPYSTVRTCPPDPAEAKRLLAAAGFPNGLDLTLYTSGVDEVFPRLAEVYQQQAAAANVRIAIRLVPSDSYFSTVWLKREFVMVRWSQRPADQILNEAYRTGGPWNESAFANARFDDVLTAARQELDPAKRKALYGEAQDILFDDGGTLIPFHINRLRVMSNRVTGLAPVQDFSIRWQDVSVAN